ncbi:MAG: GAF domain-containing protein [Deltaproteobacteria bacterium]|nr:GAF domain-containing protein [Deltaproteobacteria bacterium]
MIRRIFPSTTEIPAAKQDELVQNLSLLHEISQAMISTINLADLLEIIMTAVTMGGALGFNRAILFLLNPKKDRLQGMIGVGPDNPEEASRIWNEFSRQKMTLLEWVLTAERERFQTKSTFDEVCKNVSVPLDAGGGILALTFLEKTHFNISDEKADPFVVEHIFSRVGGSPYATVPIISKGQAIGVIMVDNIYNQKPVSDDDMKLLTIFASEAGMAIENSRLYENLERAHQELKEVQGKLIHNEKLVALGEMAATIAHEIKTPLVSIGGFARRLHHSLHAGVEKKYAEIITKEVSRLEEILDGILTFCREPDFHFGLHDVNRILEECLDVFVEEMKGTTVFIKELDPLVPGVRCDRSQIKQAFINLITNALQAMEGGGELRVKSSYLPVDNYVVVEIRDSGNGIDPEILGNIFNPFFSTKDSGVGLGLAITHKIITHHQGTILVKNNPGQGTTFLVQFTGALPLDTPE